VLDSLQNKLGGGEGVEGLYGSITAAGMHRILDALTQLCSLNLDSKLVDVGAGLGRPLMHAAVSHGLHETWGIEVTFLFAPVAVTGMPSNAKTLLVP
jgi:hypothetical protein